MTNKMDMTARAFLKSARKHFEQHGQHYGLLFVFQAESDTPLIVSQRDGQTLDGVIAVGRQKCADVSAAYVVFIREHVGDIGMPNDQARQHMLKEGITHLSGTGRFLVVSVETRSEVVVFLNKINDDATLSDDVMIMDQRNNIGGPDNYVLYGQYH